MSEPEVDDRAGITAKGPVSGVQVHNHMQFGPHAVSVPLDLTLLVQMMFMLAEQGRRGPEDAPLVITPVSLLERLRELGVVSGNGSKLVGRDAVYESFARLVAKGYIRRVEPRDERGKRVGPVRYEFYEWPAWNPEPPKVKLVSPQVAAGSGIAGSGNAGSSDGNRAKSASQQVGSTSGNDGSGNAGSSGRARTSSQVGSTSGNAGSPPHPPEEGGTTSPVGKQATASPDELDRAAQFLMHLPGAWACGKQQAAKLAPLLLSQATEMGWELDLALRVWLTRNEAGKKAVENYHATLRWRLSNLVYRDAAMAAGEESAEAPKGAEIPGQPIQGGLPKWCGKCGDPGSHPLVNVARINPRMRTHNGEINGTPCPTCHPSAVAAQQN